MSFLDRFKLQPNGSTPIPRPRRGGRRDSGRRRARVRDPGAGVADEDVAGPARGGGRLTRRAGTSSGWSRGRERDEEHRARVRSSGSWRSRLGTADTDGDAALALEGSTIRSSLATWRSTRRTTPCAPPRSAGSHDVKALEQRRAARRARADGARRGRADRGSRGAAEHRDQDRSQGRRHQRARTRRRSSEPGSDVRETLEALAARAKNKSVAKRARAMIQAMDEAEAARRRARSVAAAGRRDCRARRSARRDAGTDGRGRRARRRRSRVERRSAPGGRSSSTRTSRRALRRRAGERAAAHRRASSARGRAPRRRRAPPARTADARADPSGSSALRGDDALDEIAVAQRRMGRARPAPRTTRTPPSSARPVRQACRRGDASGTRTPAERSRRNARLDELAREAEQLAAEDELQAEAWSAIVARVEHAARAVGRRSTRRSRSAISGRRAACGSAATSARRRGRAGAAAAGAAHRAADRARRTSARSRRPHAERSRPAARDLRAAIETPPAIEEREQHALRRAAQGRGGGGRAEAPRAARDGRVEAVRQRRRPGRADRAGRSAPREVRLRHAGRSRRRTTSIRRRASCTTSRSAGRAPPKRRARRRRRCGTATARPPIRSRRGCASSSRTAPRSARPTSR